MQKTSPRPRAYNPNVKELARRAAAWIESVPFWVFPCGYVLLGFWELREWATGHNDRELVFAVGFLLLGAVTLVRGNNQRKRVARLKEINDTLHKKLEPLEPQSD